MEKKVDLMIKYLETLQNGRIRPDNRGGTGTVRDAYDNIPSIDGTKTAIEKLLEIDRNEEAFKRK